MIRQDFVKAIEYAYYLIDRRMYELRKSNRVGIEPNCLMYELSMRMCALIW